MGCGSSTPEPAPTAQTVAVKTEKISNVTGTPIVAAPEYDVTYKFLLLGDSGVGKSALMFRFADDTFKPNLISTVGIDFKMKTVNMDGKRVKMQIWDTAGQERFRTVTKTYYRGAQGYILAYDITNPESFEHVKYWLDEIAKNAPGDVPKCIVGNKCDLEDSRIITTEQGRQFAEEFKIPFTETSAKDGHGVQDMFMQMAQRAMQQSPT